MSTHSRQLPRVQLEPPQERHAAGLIAAVKRSRKLHRGWVDPPDTRSAYYAYVGKLQSAREFGYLIKTEHGELAGVVNLNEIVMGAFKSAYLGYYGLLPWVGGGYVSAGVRAVIRKAFSVHGLHRLEANVQPDNQSSIRLVRRLGFRMEGLSLRYLKIGGRWRDHERWAITREDLRRSG